MKIIWDMSPSGNGVGIILGKVSLEIDDSKVIETVEALHILGYEPEVIL